MLTTGEKRTMTEEEVLEHETREVQAMSPAEFHAYERRATLECLDLLMDQVDQLIKELDKLKGERSAGGLTREQFGDMLADAHRGTWKADVEFSRGTLVNWEGSSWLARKTSRGIRPGTDDTWHLLSHKGRDGRDRVRTSRP